MNLNVLPLRAIFSGFLILLVVIAIESFVFQRRLKFVPKVSVEYATVINLISTCVGWVLFFYVVTLLPSFLEKELVAYVLFGKFGNLYPVMIIFVLTAFVISLIVKLLSFNFCEYLWDNKTQESGMSMNLSQAFSELKTPKFLVITVAHTCSRLAILFLLFLQRSELT